MAVWISRKALNRLPLIGAGERLRLRGRVRAGEGSEPGLSCVCSLSQPVGCENTGDPLTLSEDRGGFTLCCGSQQVDSSVWNVKPFTSILFSPYLGI